MFEEWGWTADIVQSDYGEDLDCCVYSGGQRTSLHFRCQIKSTSRATRTRGVDYRVAVNATTCAAWVQSHVPILLVLYDRRDNQAYFINASAHLRADVKAITRRSVSFTVPRAGVLRTARERLIKEVQDHYAAFLRVSDSVHCTVFPILMPRYRAALPRTDFAIDEWEWDPNHRDRLPAWTTVFETMDAEHLYGLKREFSGANLDAIYAELMVGLETSSLVDVPGQWLALSCYPIEFQASRSEEPSIWTGELTGWRSFARIHGRVVDDRDYAFAPPAGFMTEVARHSRSWDDFYHVDPKRDLAIQLYASVPLTPAYRAKSQSMRANAAGQLLPWSCPVQERERLLAALGSSGLTFSSIDAFSTNEAFVGVIHHPMLIIADGFTSIPMALDWTTFDHGAVRKIIDDLPVGTLPGSEAAADVREHVLDQLPSWVVKPKETFYGVQHDTPRGMPVNLVDRRILIERFHALERAVDAAPFEDIAAEAKRTLTEFCPHLYQAEITFQVHDTDIYPVIRLALSWHPPVQLSSASAFLEVEDVLLREFDRILPRRAGPGAGPHGTFDVLRVAGSIHFDPDYWNRWREVAP